MSTMRAAHLDLIETHLIGAQTRERIIDADRCGVMAAHGMKLCGLSDAASPYRMVRGKLDFGEIIVGISGEGRVWLDGGWRVLNKGEAYIAPRGARQAFYAVPRRRWRFAWVQYVEKPGATRVIAGSEAWVCAADSRALATAVGALADELNGTAEREVLGLLAGWVDLEARKIVRGARPPDARLRGLWEKVEGELSRSWSVTDLARVAGVGPEQLRRLCHVAHGTSPLEHLFRLRMARAAALLSGTPLKAEVIAEAVGYGGVFAFSAAFKRRYGLAPSHYRSKATHAQVEGRRAGEADSVASSRSVDSALSSSRG